MQNIARFVIQFNHTNKIKQPGANSKFEIGGVTVSTSIRITNKIILTLFKTYMSLINKAD
jgi:hypothetical protein